MPHVKTIYFSNMAADALGLIHANALGPDSRWGCLITDVGFPLWMWADHMIISSLHWNFLCRCEGVLTLNQPLELRGPYQPLTPAKQFHKYVELTWNSEMQSLQK